MAFRITYSVLNADLTELHQAFDGALAEVRRGLDREYPSWIGNEPVHTGDFMESFNPADTRERVARFHQVTPGHLDAAFASARVAQRTWARRPWQERVAVLRRAADLISERRLKYAAIMSLEVGKSRLEALGDVEESADLFRYYAGQVEETSGFVKPLARLSPNEDTRSVLKPYGVFVVVSPFNFPMALAAGMTAGALLGGNAVLHKPSKETPWVAECLREALHDAGLEPALFQLIYGRGAVVGDALTLHPGVDGVAFTGSADVGLRIFRGLITDRVRPCLLELGGKNAALVCESADLDKAVEGCYRSGFGLQGQKCSAMSRIYVHASRAAEFRERLVARIAQTVIGPPSRADVFLGPVINAAAVKTFERAAEEARRDGRILSGGTRLTDGELAHGHFVAPTLVEVPDGHRLTRDELFLPFVTFNTFETLEQAVGMSNAADYGLTGGIFSEEQRELDYFFDEVEAGCLYSNRKTGATTGAWPGVQAFCGWKRSGATGKGGCGPYYVSQFMREQSQTRML